MSYELFEAILAGDALRVERITLANLSGEKTPNLDVQNTHEWVNLYPLDLAYWKRPDMVKPLRLLKYEKRNAIPYEMADLKAHWLRNGSTAQYININYRSWAAVLKQNNTLVSDNVFTTFVWDCIDSGVKPEQMTTELGDSPGRLSYTSPRALTLLECGAIDISYLEHMGPVTTEMLTKLVKGRLIVTQKWYDYFKGADHIINILRTGKQAPTETAKPAVTSTNEQIKEHVSKHGGAAVYIDRAIESGDTEMFKWLIAHGAYDTDPRIDHMCRAAALGHSEIVAYFLNNGVAANVRDNQPVIAACGGGHLDLAQMLVKHGADALARNQEALRVGANHPDIVRWLVSLGADISTWYAAAFKKARDENNTKMIDMLIEIGARAVASVPPAYVP